MSDNCERCLKYKELNEDNTRAWQKVADLEKRLRDAFAETNRLSSELARTYE